MKWNIDDVPIFVAIVDHKGISAAAGQLGISKSTVSKSLTRLESALEIRLIERNSRNVRITHEGQVFYRHCQGILEQVDNTNAEMSGLAIRPSGKLVVALPIAFCREIVAPRLLQFQQQYPAINLEIIVTSHPVDLIRDQIDLAVTIGAQTDSELITRALYNSKLLLITSPDYAATHDLGDSAEALQAHLKICEKRYASNRFPIRIGNQSKTLDFTENTIKVNDPLSVREAIINGMGVSVLPDQYCHEAIRKQQLVRVYRSISIDASASSLSVIYPSRRLLSSTTRAFLDFLDNICKEI